MPNAIPATTLPISGLEYAGLHTLRVGLTEAATHVICLAAEIVSDKLN